METQQLPSGFGAYLEGILPQDIAIACGAFSTAMMQIKNIKQMNIEKFSQVAGSVETTKGLNVNGSNVPTNTALATGALPIIALGSGPYGTYTCGDFFGCMSGTTYDFKKMVSALTAYDQPTLQPLINTYNTMLAILTGLGPYDAALNPLISVADAQINAIAAAKPVETANLNAIWNAYGTQLTLERAARDKALELVVNSDPVVPFASDPITKISWVDSLSGWAGQTEPHMYAQTIEAIADWNTDGGRSLVALLRELRNTERLTKIGVELDNNISDTLSESEQKELIANGNSNLYTPTSVTDPQAYGYYDVDTDRYVLTNTDYTSTLSTTPSSAVFGLGTDSSTIDSFTSAGAAINPLGKIVPVSSNFSPLSVPYGIVLDVGGPAVPGSFGGSPYQNLIDPNLNTVYTSKQLSSGTYTVGQSIAQVIDCNCQCW